MAVIPSGAFLLGRARRSRDGRMESCTCCRPGGRGGALARRGSAQGGRSAQRGGSPRGVSLEGRVQPSIVT